MTAIRITHQTFGYTNVTTTTGISSLFPNDSHSFKGLRTDLLEIAVELENERDKALLRGIGATATVSKLTRILSRIAEVVL